MRALLAALLAIALALGGSGSTQADEGSKPPVKSKGSWFTRLFTFGKKERPTPATEKEKATTEPSKRPEASGRSREQEESILGRRQEVCHKLREIAVQTRDDNLLRKADQLDQRAWSTYLKRTGGAPAGHGSFQSDEEVLARHLAPAAPSPRALETSNGIPGSSTQGRAQLREDEP
jgi:hypothetical protein